VTVDRAFEIKPNVTVVVTGGAILTVRDGNSTNMGTVQVGFNSTFRYVGQLTMGANSSLVITASRNCSIGVLRFDDLSVFSFGVGCAVGAALIILLLILLRNYRMKKSKEAATTQLRKRTVDEADRMKANMQRESEAEDRRKRESLKLDEQQKNAIPEEGIMEL